MKGNRSVLSIVAKIISILILLLGFVLLLYIFLGPSLGLIDAESASFGILLAFPVIVIGVLSVVLSFIGYPKVSLTIVVILASVIILNVWNQNRMSAINMQRMADRQTQNNSFPPLQSPSAPTTSDVKQGINCGQRDTGTDTVPIVCMSKALNTCTPAYMYDTTRNGLVAVESYEILGMNGNVCQVRHRQYTKPPQTNYVCNYLMSDLSSKSDTLFLDAVFNSGFNCPA